MLHRAIFISSISLSLSFAMTSLSFAQTIEAQGGVMQEEIRKVQAYKAYLDKKTASTQPKKIELFEPETVVKSAENSSYTVKQGDTLYNLARAHCLSVSGLREQNGLADNKIKIGQKLNILAGNCALSVPSTQVETVKVLVEAPQDTPVSTRETTENIRRVMPVPTSLVSQTSAQYAVLPNDTLFAIGKRYCLSADALASFNGFDAKRAIKPGQILRVPEQACVK